MEELAEEKGAKEEGAKEEGAVDIMDYCFNYN